MKKLILVSAIAALSSATVQAVTLYDAKGFSYQLKGDFQLQLRKDPGSDQSLEVEFDDLELQNRIEYVLDDNLRAFGQLDVGYKYAAENEQDGSHLEEAYVGLDFGTVRVAVGKMDFASDEFGVEQAYENKQKEDRFDKQGTDGDDVIRVDAKLGKFDLVASYEFEAEGDDQTSDNGKYFDLFVSTEVAGFEVGAAYQSSSAIANPGDTWGLSAVFDAGVAKLGADYSSSNLKGNDADQINLVAVMPIDSTTKVAVGLARIDEDTKDTVIEWYANVTYKLPAQKNVSFFAEIADTDENNVSIGYLAGMRLQF